MNTTDQCARISYVYVYVYVRIKPNNEEEHKLQHPYIRGQGLCRGLKHEAP